jgi:hypothetical protein
VPPNSTLIQYSFRAHSSPFANPLSLTTNDHIVWVGDVNDSGMGLLRAFEIVTESSNGDDVESTVGNEQLKEGAFLLIFNFYNLSLGILSN